MVQEGTQKQYCRNCCHFRINQHLCKNESTRYPNKYIRAHHCALF
ncbi:hypothetical protein NEIMUCOT_04103 [Neisseria mucosa ATCC 25996]|uniref:Uncharacterized protein n=1 Tax=Neisseria mucosa (strain ATCC 25996 / DSM 4631 / NCTC 10774 / M26) TaxID=546266 RepID=D2ZU15_NEIM2|nr:hypothetical protein NEIMUCOT_04103 [Neisseria mucosa ATCC 25996]